MDNTVAVKENKKDKSLIVWRVIMIIVPLVEALVLVAIFSIAAGEFATPGILWNDEGSYNALIKTYAQFGSSVGYYGFNGVHAIVGTGSGWSPALIWPFSIPAMILPVGMSYVFWMNIFYMTLANLGFVLLAKPSRKNAVNLTAIQLLSIVPILYLATNMSEIFRFALAVLIAGLLLHMMREDRNRIVTYVIAPLVILYALLAYIFFVFAVPIYVYLLLKDKRKILSIPLSLLSLPVAGGGMYACLHFILCNYNIGKTERVFDHLSSGEFVTAFVDVLKMAKDGLIEIVYLKNYIFVNPIYPVHTLILIVIFILGVIVAATSRKDVCERYLGGAVAFAVFIFTAGYATLYTIVPDTFLRGIEIVVIFALFMMCMTKKSWTTWILIALCALEVFTLPKAISTFIPPERFVTSEVKENWNELADKVGDAIVLDKDASAWDNTVIMFTTEPRIVYAIPTGMGINYSLTYDTVCPDAGYLLFTKRKDGKPEWVDTDFDTYCEQNGAILDNRYDIVYDDGEYVIYHRRDI